MITKKRFYNFKEKLDNLLNTINNKITKRKKKKMITFKDIIYYCSLLNGNDTSYDSVNATLRYDNILEVTKNALIKKRNNIDITNFNELNNMLIKYLYEDTKNIRYIAVDGSQIHCSKQLINDEFKIYRNNKHYCTALVSCLYDVDNDIPINYKLSKSINEREILISQLDYIKPKDVLIMDRGYFSYDLLNILINKKINVVFRLSKKMGKAYTKNKLDNTFIINTNKFKTKTKTKIKFRVIKYTIKDKEYYLGTTLFNKSIDFLKNLYWKRWSIEVHFRKAKFNLSLIHLKSKSGLKIEQDIAIHNFIFLMNCFIKKFIDKLNKKKYIINDTISLDFTINKVLYILFYDKSTNNKIFNKILTVVNILKVSLIIIKPNRIYKRRRLFPHSCWIQTGKKFYKMKILITKIT